MTSHIHLPKGIIAKPHNLEDTAIPAATMMERSASDIQENIFKLLDSRLFCIHLLIKMRQNNIAVLLCPKEQRGEDTVFPYSSNSPMSWMPRRYANDGHTEVCLADNRGDMCVFDWSKNRETMVLLDDQRCRHGFYHLDERPIDERVLHNDNTLLLGLMAQGHIFNGVKHCEEDVLFVHTSKGGLLRKIIPKPKTSSKKHVFLV